MIASRRLATWAVLSLLLRAGREVLATEPPLTPSATAAAEATPPVPPTVPLFYRFKASIGYHYSAGDYGGSGTTEINYVPLVLTAEIDRWLVELTIPYLHIDGPAGIIEGPNGPIESNGKGDGLGDLLMKGSYLIPIRSLLPDPYAFEPWVPFVEIIGLVKFPTASASQGLGTGEFDFGFEGELTWVIGKLTPFASAGYRVLGSPPGSDLDNVFVGSIGGLYQFLASLSAGLLLDYRQAALPSTGQQLELVPFASGHFLPPWSLEGYVAAGLSDGSPDVGVGVQFGYTW